MSAARYMLSIKGATLCPDTDCAAIGDAHKLGCRGKLITKQQSFNRCYAAVRCVRRALLAV